MRKSYLKRKSRPVRWNGFKVVCRMIPLLVRIREDTTPRSGIATTCGLPVFLNCSVVSVRGNHFRNSTGNFDQAIKAIA